MIVPMHPTAVGIIMSFATILGCRVIDHRVFATVLGCRIFHAPQTVFGYRITMSLQQFSGTG